MPTWCNERKAAPFLAPSQFNKIIIIMMMIIIKIIIIIVSSYDLKKTKATRNIKTQVLPDTMTTINEIISYGGILS